MSRKYGSQSMVGELQAVLVRRPDGAFGNADPHKWHYTSAINLDIAQQEHDALIQTLQNCGTEVVYHDVNLPNHADSIFVHDPVIVSDQGAILLNMGKPLRQGEEDAIEELIPKLCLKGISTNDFGEALQALVGENAKGLSPNVIVRLKDQWSDEYDAWSKRDLSEKHYVYIWADGIYAKVRLEDDANKKQCMLVLMGAFGLIQSAHVHRPR